MRVRKRVLASVVLVPVLAVLVAVLSSTVRKWLFTQILLQLVSSHNPEMTKLRCDVVGPASGRVLEIGPGTGINFHCWKGSSAIQEYYGVEPNPFMHEHLRRTAAEQGISFPVHLSNSSAEALGGFADGSFDTVVSTHVLCSVTSAPEVLKEVVRVLKPGGRFLFLEHVAAPEGSVRTAQNLLGTVWSIFGDGCSFRDTYSVIAAAGLAQLDARRLDAPVPLSIIKPHVVGSAIK